MNILVVCHYGLYENLSFSFVHNQVREFVNLGHNVRVLCPIGIGKKNRNGKRFSLHDNDITVDGVQIFDIPYITLSSYGEKSFNTQSAITSIRLYKKALKGFNPDIIHAHTLGFDSDIGAYLKGRFNCPLVVTTHGSDTENPLNLGKTKEFFNYCEKADAIVAVSSKLANRVRSCKTATPVYSVVNGFVPHAHLGEITRDPMRIIQVCNLIPLKRVAVTIKAFAKLKAIHPEMTLVITGRGPERENLEKLCSELKVTESVTFTGQLDNAKVFEEMCKSTYFVMVSKPEGFGIVYLEAMAAGCITIGTKGEGIADVINNGKNGYLLTVDSPDEIVDTINSCINNLSEKILITENAVETVKMLDWHTNSKKYIDIFTILKGTEE